MQLSDDPVDQLLLVVFSDRQIDIMYRFPKARFCP